MPLYEYQCQECGEVHEILQNVSDVPMTICSTCGGSLKKLLSAPAIQFKGSGFYITDYGKGNGSGKGTGKGESGGGGESAKSGESARGDAAGAAASPPAKS